MFKEAGKFFRNHPFLGFVFAASSIYVASENFRALRASEGDYWGKGIYGLGSLTAQQKSKLVEIEGELRKASKMHASQADRISQIGGPFARHQRAKSMRVSPTGASLSTTTSTSSSHAMFRDVEAGEPSMPMPMMLHGIPSSIKRRVGHGEYNQEVLPDEYGISGMHLGEGPRDASDIIGSDEGIMPMMGGEGWI